MISKLPKRYREFDQSDKRRELADYRNGQASPNDAFGFVCRGNEEMLSR
jgi:hypothetical protein